MALHVIAGITHIYLATLMSVCSAGMRRRRQRLPVPSLHKVSPLVANIPDFLF
jgi:hypothetical protein